MKTLAIDTLSSRSKRGNDGVLFPFLGLAVNSSILNNVFAGLSVDKAVVPGEPIPITIFFWSFNHALDFGTGCLIKIFLVRKTKSGAITKTEVFRSPNDGTFIPYTGPAHIDIGDFHSFIDPPSSATALGKNLYAFGEHTLEMQITTNGNDKGPYTDQNPLWIVPEQVDQSWWIWGAGVPFLFWKEDYTLSGFCVNKTTANIGIDFNTTLEETDEDGNTKGYDTLFTSLPVNGQSGELEFQRITQDWKWLAEAIWIVIGPFLKGFVYIATLDIVDEYGNQYPSFSSSPRGVVVNVSDKKQKLAEAAAGTGFAAIFLTVVSILAPWVGIAAAGVGITSAVLGALALDPPEPDKDFLTVLQPPAVVISKPLQMEKRLSEFRSFYKIIIEIANSITLLSKIEGKLMGAQLVNSSEGMNLQKKVYRKTVSSMYKKAMKLSDITETTLQSFVNNGVFENKELKNLQFKDVAGHLKKMKLKKLLIEQTKIIMNNTRARTLFLSDEAIQRMLRFSSLSLINTVQMINNETAEKLKKYAAKK